MTKIAKIRIHPAIGIARVGNHPSSYFIGPEKPYFVATIPSGGYKEDDNGVAKVKRQAARFRLYGYDENDRLLNEITTDDAEITWTVHLANKKASWHEFDQLNPNAPLRNRLNTPDDQRDKLNIDTGPRSVSGSEDRARFDGGSYTEWNDEKQPKTINDIVLGDLLTDSLGRLLVLGGFGKAASPWNTPLGRSTFNNDGWHDDISDGPVDAKVVLKSGETVPVVGAWVICPPPNFAPSIGNLVPLYDTIYQKYRDNGQYDGFVRSGLLPPINDPPSWNYDVYPLLKRVANIPWVIDIGAHRQITGEILNPDLASNMRLTIFNFLKPPDLSSGSMPRLLGDVPRELDKSFAFTKTQYLVWTRWKDGRVVADGTHGRPLSADDVEVTPQGLDRAALENCAGGGFHPGIEASWFLRDIYDYSEPFRLSREQGLTAGDVSKQMAIPWHTDVYTCDKQEGRDWGFTTWGFWPGVRPDDVVPENPNANIDSERRPWVEGWVNSKEEMIANWSNLGFVVETQKDPPVHTETERNAPG